MRFVIGLLAAIFAVSAVPASAAQFITYTAKGVGNVQWTYYSGRDAIEVTDVTVTLTIDASSDYNMCTYWAAGVSIGICYATFNNSGIHSTIYDISSQSFTNAALSLTFAGEANWPTNASTFTGGNFSGIAQWGIFNINLTSLSVAVSDTPIFKRFEIMTSLAVPEPASWAMMIGGFALLGATMRRRAAMALTI